MNTIILASLQLNSKPVSGIGFAHASWTRNYDEGWDG